MFLRFFYTTTHLGRKAIRYSSRCLIFNTQPSCTPSMITSRRELTSSSLHHMKADPSDKSVDRIIDKFNSSLNEQPPPPENISVEDDQSETIRTGNSRSHNLDMICDDFYQHSLSVLENRLSVEEFVKSEEFKEVERYLHYHIDRMSNAQLVSLIASTIKMRMDPNLDLIRLLEHEAKFRASELKISQIIKLLKFYQTIELSSEQKQVVDVLINRFKSFIQGEQASLDELVHSMLEIQTLQAKDILKGPIEERILSMLVELNGDTCDNDLAATSLDNTRVKSDVSYETLCRLFVAFAECKSRPTPIMKQASTLIMTSGSGADLPKELLIQVYSALASLNYPQQQVLNKLTNDLITNLDLKRISPQNRCNLLRALSKLRWRSDILMERFYEFAVENKEDSKFIDHNILSDIFYVTALLNYKPKVDLKGLYSTCLKNGREQNIAKTSRKWLNYVWSLAYLNVSEEHHFVSILNDRFIESMISNNTLLNNHGSLMSVLNLNALAKYELKLSCADPVSTRHIEQNYPRGAALQKYAAKVESALSSICGTSDKTRTEIDTPFGFKIDCEMLLDSNKEPQSLEGIPTLSDILKNPGIDIAPTGYTRLALIYVLYNDTITSHEEEVVGHRQMAERILRNIGYKVVLLPETIINREKTSADLSVKIKNLIQGSQ